MPDIRWYAALATAIVETAEEKKLIEEEGEDRFLDAFNDSLNSFHERKPGDYPEFSEEDWEALEEWAYKFSEEERKAFVVDCVDYYWTPNSAFTETCPRKELYFMLCEVFSEADAALSGEE